MITNFFKQQFSKQESTISDPPDINKSIEDLFEEVLKGTNYEPILPICEKLFVLAVESIQKIEKIVDIKNELSSINSSMFEEFIHILHISMFIKTLNFKFREKRNSAFISTPVTHATLELVGKLGMKESLKFLKFNLVDVLTAHPVDMDRGLIVNHKYKIEELNRRWEIKKKGYRLLKEENVMLAARAELGDLSLQIRDILCQLIHTPNYRKNKIRPESEQRNLSRTIKETEHNIVTHWPKLILFVQFIFFETIIKDNLNKSTKKQRLELMLNLPRTKENYDLLCDLDFIKEHELFSDITALTRLIRYELQIWRGDMDGNPFVTGDTVALSIAYGRKRCFEGVSADHTVIRYNPENEQFKLIEDEMALRLVEIKKLGQKAWINYVLSREKESWSPTQIYSGLIYYRMVEMTEAAEKYLREKNDISLLNIGFKNEKEFLEDTYLLEKAEAVTGLKTGIWTTLRQLVNLRGLSLGLPHARKGESFHLELMNDFFSFFSQKNNVNFINSETELKKEALRSFLKDTVDISVLKKANLSDKSSELFENYLKMMEIQRDFCLIQSDSGSETKDIELSILLIKSISHLIGHTGNVVLLCEDEVSMTSAINLMEKNGDDTGLFDRVIMMCAGSDNQKKMGPFYSAYVNNVFLKTAHKKGIKAFFGVGDSPLRSSAFDPQCSLKTFQPGSRKLYFLGDNIFSYLSHRMANQIRHITYNDVHNKDVEKVNELIVHSLSNSMLKAYSSSIKDRVNLHKAIQEISEIVTTYFSRPSKKYGGASYILDAIRAIDSGRAQLILNTFDPQLSGFNEGLDDFKKILKENEVSVEQVHAFFNNTQFGNSFLNTLEFFIKNLDDNLSGNNDFRHVNSKDIVAAYTSLSGKKIQIETDPYLRLSRLVWAHVSDSCEMQKHQAVAMMLFGSNWMI